MSLFKKLLNIVETRVEDTPEVRGNFFVDERFSKYLEVTATMVPLSKANYRELTRRFIAIDLETTGFDSQADRIIEFSAILFENRKIVKGITSLINPGIAIPPGATKVNHITNQMVRNAPTEKFVLDKFCEFAPDALEGGILLCAHNAIFDMRFLTHALRRCGYDGTIKYVDTLTLARKYIKGPDNYKLGTLAHYLDINQENAHRAADDAIVCGNILTHILESAKKDFLSPSKLLLSEQLDDEELETFAWIQNMLVAQGCDIRWLRGYKNKGGYVSFKAIENVFKFKKAKHGKYLVLLNQDETIDQFLTAPCTYSEGGSDYIRVYFNNPDELWKLRFYLADLWQSALRDLKVSLALSLFDSLKIEEELARGFILDPSTIQGYLNASQQRRDAGTYTKIDINYVESANKTITRSEVTINPVHTRVPFELIRNLDNEFIGFEEGMPYYMKGDILRKEGNFKDALALFDLARFNGYFAPALYQSYAMLYRKLKDCDNEVAILDEAIERAGYKGSSWAETRRQRALELLLKERAKKDK